MLDPFPDPPRKNPGRRLPAPSGIEVKAHPGVGSGCEARKNQRFGKGMVGTYRSDSFYGESSPSSFFEQKPCGNPGYFLGWRDLVGYGRDEWEKKKYLAWMKGIHGLQANPDFFWLYPL